MTPDVAKLKKKRDVKRLIRAIWNKKVGYKAVEALEELKDPCAAEELCKLLNDPRGNTSVSYVANALAQINDRRAVIPLLEALDRTKSPCVIRALSELRDAQAVEPLCLLLRDQDSNMRTSVATSLAKLGDRRAVAPLLAVFHEQAEDSPPAFSMALALAQLGNPEGIDTIKRRLLNGEPPNIWNKGVACADALAALGEPKWKQWIRGEDEKDLERMLTSGDPSVVEPLVANISSQFLSMLRTDFAHGVNSGANTAVAQRLSTSRHPRAVDTFIEALGWVQDSYSCYGSYNLLPSWMEIAIRTLGEMREYRAAELLCKFLELNGNIYVSSFHKTVTEALVKIGPPAVEHLHKYAGETLRSEHANEVLKRINSTQGIASG